jgi:hypothetical protein
MRFARWMTKATDTHLEYVIFYYFYATTMVMRTHLSVAFIHSPSCNLQPQYFRVFSLHIIPPVLQHLWFVYMCDENFFQDVFRNVSLNAQQSVTVTKNS